jgi:hypothetical protein
MRSFYVCVSSEEPIFSPFSGEPVDGEEGCNAADPTLQWVFYGDPAITVHVGTYLRDALGLAGDEDESTVALERIRTAIGDAGGLVLEVNTGWNGTNCYGFVPHRAGSSRSS